MKIQVCSQWELEALAVRPFDVPTALISIGGVGTPPPELLHQPRYMLRLEFSDTRPSLDSKHVFSPAQAEEIAAFVYAHKGSVQALICQCQLGCFRSAAVAAAIMEHLGQDGMELFVDGKHCPNLFVFSMVLIALEKQACGGRYERSSNLGHFNCLPEDGKP